VALHWLRLYLLPADRRVNQHGKRDRLPLADALRAARDTIAAWWSAAYFRLWDAVLPSRFAAEAHGSLPGLDTGDACHRDDVQLAIALQRMRRRRISACRSGAGGPERRVPSNGIFPDRPFASAASPSWFFGQPALNTAVHFVDQDAAALDFDGVPAGQQRLDSPVAGFPGGAVCRVRYEEDDDAGYYKYPPDESHD
jgi:hypothetical protein